jgi:hypothetical protein
MDNRNRIRKIYQFFSRNSQIQLRTDFSERFGFHPATFGNKMSPNSRAIISEEEILFCVQWARDHGMPEEKLNEEDHSIAS